MAETKWVVAVVLALVVVGGAWFFAAIQPQQAPAPAPASSSVQNRSVSGETVVFDVKVSRLGYSPERISAEKFDTLVLNIRSTDGLDHGFSLPIYNISERVPGGEEITVEFDATRAGVFEFYSNVASHTNAGNVRGSLIVTE